MGYVAQEGGLPEFLTVEQTLDLFCGLHSIKSMAEDRADVNTLYCDVLQGFRSGYCYIIKCCIPGKKGHRSGAGDALDGIAGNGYSDIGGDGFMEGQGDVCLQVDGCDVISSSHIKHSVSYQTGLRTDLSHSYDHVSHRNTASSSFIPTLAPSSASASASSTVPPPLPLNTPVPLPLTVSLTTPWGHLVGSSPTSILPPKYLSYPVHTLSGGNKKKLSVAISSINNPSFLAVDECTTGTALSPKDHALSLIYYCSVIL